MAAKPDLTEFFRYSRPKKRPCPIAFVSEQLKEQERAQFEGALQHDKTVITSSAISQWCKKRGFEVTFAAVTAHRNGVCACASG